MNMQVNAIIRNIRVNFDSSVNNRHFNQNAFQKIRDTGLFLTDLSLIHYASIYYQSRFRNSIPRRIKHTIDTIEPSLMNNSDRFFYFSDVEDSELQKASSEVIGVGFAVHLMHRLLDVKLREISKIPITGNKKRCDYEVIKNGERYIFESKGRKRNVKGAKEEILIQKNSYPSYVNYGIVTHIPRNGAPCNIHVCDPENELPEVNRDYHVIRMLNHYSKVARLAGYYGLSEAINERLENISNSINHTIEFDNYPLEYNRPNKIGKVINISILNNNFSSFFSGTSELGLKWNFSNGSMLIFGLVDSVIEILEKQNFDALLQYSLDVDSINKEKYSALDNGTIVTMISEGEAKEAMNR